MQIGSGFDGGNIQVMDIRGWDDIRLEIRPDQGGEFMQWFYYRLVGARGQACVMKLENAGRATYPEGWRDYRAVASYDRSDWFRVATEFDGSTLTIRHTPARDSVWYAYFTPYSMERHHDLIARCQNDPRVRLEVLGKTPDGQDMDLLNIGEAAPGKRHCWVIARQHPGETMAEWWMEGFLLRLLDPEDAVSRRLLEQAVFHVVPNMNPDGSRRGHLRTNALGVNLNREWQSPSVEKSPEVWLVKERMAETGVDFCLDVHGDEALPYNFIAGFEGIPSITDRQLGLLEEFRKRLEELSPDFQTAHGYNKAAPGQANLTMCTNHIAETFGCLAMTLEMPFKDAANRPDERRGWSPGRSRALAQACLYALYFLVGRLR
ncbi:MAG: M14-type cytosolic carboxypeptidase [Candidatus Competibacteraceae bacterium]|nr:M14-type cytosolic carboxypeptidase [Candidatus Competibacteraceae bacterium]